jgi:DNA-directed RNA polymerase delta subunit
MCFNLAYAIYKLKEPSVDFMRIWREEIKDIYYKTLAQFNLAVVTFYQNLAQP